MNQMLSYVMAAAEGRNASDHHHTKGWFFFLVFVSEALARCVPRGALGEGQEERVG